MALSSHKYPVYENLDNSKRLHSENDEPAKVFKYFDPITANSDLTQAEWYHHGYRHRKGQPALVRTDGHQEWWDMDTRHNPTGPAIIRADGTGTFYIYDEELTPEKIKAKCGARVSTKPPYFESQTDKMIWLQYAAKLMADPMNAAILLQKALAAEISREIDQEIIKAIVTGSKFQTLSLSPELCARTEPTRIDLSTPQSTRLGAALRQAFLRLPSAQS
jgi:hypothetical protein